MCCPGPLSKGSLHLLGVFNPPADHFLTSKGQPARTPLRGQDECKTLVVLVSASILAKAAMGHLDSNDNNGGDGSS